MIEFAVHIPGHHEVIEPTPEEREAGAEGDQKMGSWVLAIDRDSVLISHDDKSLHWHPLEKCEFLQMTNPIAPTVITTLEPLPVVAVTTEPQIVFPPNRMERRHPPA